MLQLAFCVTYSRDFVELGCKIIHPMSSCGMFNQELTSSGGANSEASYFSVGHCLPHKISPTLWGTKKMCWKKCGSLYTKRPCFFFNQLLFCKPWGPRFQEATNKAWMMHFILPHRMGHPPIFLPKPDSPHLWVVSRKKKADLERIKKDAPTKRRIKEESHNLDISTAFQILYPWGILWKLEWSSHLISPLLLQFDGICILIMSCRFVGSLDAWDALQDHYHPLSASAGLVSGAMKPSFLKHQCQKL